MHVLQTFPSIPILQTETYPDHRFTQAARRQRPCLAPRKTTPFTHARANCSVTLASCKQRHAHGWAGRGGDSPMAGLEKARQLHPCRSPGDERVKRALCVLGGRRDLPASPGSPYPTSLPSSAAGIGGDRRAFPSSLPTVPSTLPGITQQKKRRGRAPVGVCTATSCQSGAGQPPPGGQ